MTTEFYIGILIGIVVAPFIYVLMDIARVIHRHASNRSEGHKGQPVFVTASNIEDDESIGPIIEQAFKPQPESCFVCNYYTGDPYNECCEHPGLDPAFTNINTKPKQMRMDGCPLG